MLLVPEQGLGELYADDYQAKVQGVTAPDKQDKQRDELRAMTRALFAKLDALSHFHYAPFKPAEDVAVRSDVPSLAAEEVAPQVWVWVCTIGNNLTGITACCV